MVYQAYLNEALSLLTIDRVDFDQLGGLGARLILCLGAQAKASWSTGWAVSFDSEHLQAT